MRKESNSCRELRLETAGGRDASLAKFFNFEISGLADRFLMEIEENVNAGAGKRQSQLLTLPFPICRWPITNI
jgi:hypothetical protein